jgi:DNA-binding CsgD family transcriptional regulator
LAHAGIGRGQQHEELLLERSEELAAFAALLDRAGGGEGGLVLVEGPAGIGKTTLLQACARGAEARGMRRLGCRGDELALCSSFAAVRELLWPAVSAADARVLDPAARLGMPVFEAGGGEVDADRAAVVVHGLYWLVANLAERGPVLLALDDAHWLDPASARFVVHLARRIDSLPAVLAVAARPAAASALIGELSGLASRVLSPGPLSEQASATVVRAELGARADQALCRSCHQATGGNPFYLRELTGALRSEGSRPSIELAARVRSLGAGAIGRSVLVRLGRLGSDCERLAQALAVLGACSPLRHCASLAGLDRDSAAIAADALRAADVISGSQELSFAHPIVHEAVAAELPASRRARLHADAARLLAGEGAPADRVAAHLLVAEPYAEPWVVQALRGAAREALARGAPETAVAHLRRALAEPPAPDARLDVLIELGVAESRLRTAHDFEALREALRIASDARRRGEIALELAAGLGSLMRVGEAVSVLEGVLDAGGGLDPVLAERLEAVLLVTGLQLLPTDGRLRARSAHHHARAIDRVAPDPVLLVALAGAEAIGGGRAQTAVGLLRRALSDQRLLRWIPAVGGACMLMSYLDQLDDAERIADLGLEVARGRGSAQAFMTASVWHAIAAYRAGRVGQAEGHARRARELAGELGTELFAIPTFVEVLIERDLIEEAGALLESIELTEPTLSSWHGAAMLADRGRVRVARGQLEHGVADILDAERRMSASGWCLSVITNWAPAGALALARLGREQRARDLAERELAAAKAFGAVRRHGIALSLAGQLLPGTHGIGLLERAVELLARSPARLEYARAQLNLGARLRELGDREQACKLLRASLELAHECGAAALAGQARAELRAAGGRPRRPALTGPESLTPAEQRTARMAAHGLSNRQIAQALFLTTKTVEAQLSQAYAKLSIDGRAQLVDALQPSIRGSSGRRPSTP